MVRRSDVRGKEMLQTTGSYSWVDQWPVTFTQWGQGEPDITKSAACVAMADGKWNDTDCNDLRPFTCKISTGGIYR